MHQDVKRLLAFWFGSAEPEQMATSRSEWWKKDETFDRLIQQEFSSLYNRAVSGELEDWKESPLGCVALVILLDQFPRNMFRGSARSFESDEAARNVTRHVLDQEWDEDLPFAARLFLYLPLEHSENIDHQNAAVALISQLGDENYTDYAEKHRVIIKRFGRFPHRNEILGRESTQEEITFLQEPGSRF